MKKNNMAAKYNLLVLKVLLYQQTLNIYFGKQTVKLKKDFTKVSRVGLLFDLNFHCNIGQFRQLLNFWLSFRLVLLWKWNNNYSETIQCNELLRKQQQLANIWQKRYFKNELKHSRHFDHVTNDVIRSWKKKNQAVHYFPANILCRVIKSWLSIYSPRPSLPAFPSCSLPP